MKPLLIGLSALVIATSGWAAPGKRLFWGDTHLHTGYSVDAGLFGNTTGHDTAYKFARGEEVTAASGQPVKLARPLDFTAVTDER